MKKICKLILVLMVFLIIIPVSVFADNELYSESYKVVNNYINKSVELGQLEWQGFTISYHHKIYDNQLNAYGFVFDLNSNNSLGYAIVTCDSGLCSVMEASYDSPSPYKEYNDNYKYIYINVLEYIVTETASKITSNEIVFKNIETNELVHLSNNTRLRVINDNTKSNNVLISTSDYERIHYVSNYSTLFEVIGQNESYNCVATSMAMCLNYLKNMGTISVSHIDDQDSLVERIRDEITDNYGGDTSGRDLVVRKAINDFGKEYCSPRISTRGDGFWGNSPTTDISFNTTMNENSDNCPMVMMFNPGTFNGIDERHATACYGYKRVYYTDGSIYSYTIVKVPHNPSGTSTKEVLWNYQNVHGYYLVYIG